VKKEANLASSPSESDLDSCDEQGAFFSFDWALLLSLLSASSSSRFFFFQLQRFQPTEVGQNRINRDVSHMKFLTLQPREEYFLKPQ
jgi:hypothetical protein